MNKFKNILCLFLGVFMIASGCSANNQKAIQNPQDKIFYFSSGGAYHLSGYGEWLITCTPEGNFSVKHNVQGKITDYKSHQLKQEEIQKLWNLINNAKVNKIVELKRPGVPDEVAYTFKFLDPDQKTSPDLTPSYVIWVNDAHEDKNIMNLVNYIGELIKTYTAQEAVLN